MPVRYAEARAHKLRTSIQLTGAVASRRASVVAAEVGGVVSKLLAREGDRVKRGAALAQLRQETLSLTLRSAKGQLEEARARLQLAVTDLERMEGLFEESVASRQQLDSARSEWEAWGGRVVQLEAEAARLQHDLERSVVRAPFEGIVVREYTAVGEWMDAGGSVVELVDFNALELTVDVPELDFAGVSTGEAATIRFPALGGMEIVGQVRAIIPQADPQARTFPVKIDFANPEGRIGVGMLGNVQLPVGEPEEAVIVPKDAIVSQGSGRFVFRLDSENRVERIAVQTGRAAGSWVAVAGELSPRDRIVVLGNERVSPGQTVQPEEREYELP